LSLTLILKESNNTSTTNNGKNKSQKKSTDGYPIMTERHKNMRVQYSCTK